MRKHIKFILLALLAIAILWLFGRNLDWAQVKKHVAEADGRLLILAAAIVASTYFIRAFRWRTLLEPLTETTFRPLFIATTVGFASVFIFGRAGEVVRPVVLSLRDRRVGPAASFVSIMIERLCDTVVVVMIFSVSLIWVDAPAGSEHQFQTIRYIGLGLLAVTIAGLVCLRWFHHRSEAAVGWLEKRFERSKLLPQRFTRGLVSTLEQLGTALGILADLRELLRVALWSFFLWGVIISAYILVLHAFGLSFDPAQAVFVMGFAMIGSLVPTPGGAAGAFEAATAAGLIFLNIGKDQAAAVALFTHLILFAPSLVFAIYYLLRGEISITRLREMTRPEAVEHAVEDEKIHLTNERSRPGVGSAN